MPEEEGSRQRKALINYIFTCFKGGKGPDSGQSKQYSEDGGILLHDIAPSECW